MSGARPDVRPRDKSEQPRPRDAGASKAALLTAAQELFGQRGFEGTTIRDIGIRAGVDHALIAADYGSKADLYIAALVAETQGDQSSSRYEGLGDMAQGMLSRMDEHGLGPVTQALIRSDTSDEIRDVARAHLVRRMVEPMVENLTRQGVADARLQSEVCGRLYASEAPGTTE